jgi:hypothetical protein
MASKTSIDLVEPTLHFDAQLAKIRFDAIKAMVDLLEAFLDMVEAFVDAVEAFAQPVVCPVHSHRLHASSVPRSAATVAR